MNGSLSESPPFKMFSGLLNLGFGSCIAPMQTSSLQLDHKLLEVDQVFYDSGSPTVLT